MNFRMFYVFHTHSLFIILNHPTYPHYIGLLTFHKDGFYDLCSVYRMFIWISSTLFHEISLALCINNNNNSWSWKGYHRCEDSIVHLWGRSRGISSKKKSTTKGFDVTLRTKIYLEKWCSFCFPSTLNHTCLITPILNIFKQQ